MPKAPVGRYVDVRTWVLKCPHCQEEWEPRTEAPKTCPVCKGRLDAPVTKE